MYSNVLGTHTPCRSSDGSQGSPSFHKEVHCMISNQRGPTAQEAPGYGVTWGGIPLHGRRAMTVAVATLVAAGLAGPAAASAATTTSASSADTGSVLVPAAARAGHRPQ